MIFPLSPEFDPFLSDEVAKETDSVFLWLFSMLFELRDHEKSDAEAFFFFSCISKNNTID